MSRYLLAAFLVVAVTATASTSGASAVTNALLCRSVKIPIGDRRPIIAYRPQTGTDRFFAM